MVGQALVQANKYRFFSVGAIGTFMATLDGSILNVALPSIAEDLKCPVDLVAWVSLSYTLTLISLLIVFGAWTERRGYGFAYKFGYIFFVVGSVLCAFSSTIYMLIAARVVQATGSAMFAAVGPGMVATVFPEEERGKGMGLMVMMVSAGFMTGPPLGGYMLGIWSWHSIFLLNLPIGILGLFMAHRYFKLLKLPRHHRPIHLTAVLSLSLALVTGVFSLSLVDEYGLSDPQLWGPVIVSLASFLLFLKLESDPERALIGLDLFRNRLFSSSIAAQFMHFAALSGVMLLIPFYLERVKQLEPPQVGLFLVILPILMFILAPMSGRLSDRIGFRVLTGSGMMILVVGLWLLSNLNVGTEDWYIVLCLVVVGAGVGTFGTPNSSVMMGAIEQKRRAIASGILATNRNIGMSVGIALATSLFTLFVRKNSPLGDEQLIFIESFRPVIYLAIFFALLGFVFCLIRGEPRSRSLDR